MIESRHSVRARRRHLVCSRIVEVCIQAGGAGIFVVQRTSDGENLAVGQNRGVHLNAWLGHRRTLGPGGSWDRNIDNLGGSCGGIASSKNYNLRGVIRRGQWEEHRRSIGSRSAIDG